MIERKIPSIDFEGVMKVSKRKFHPIIGHEAPEGE
jgi:hypothetical protein